MASNWTRWTYTYREIEHMELLLENLPLLILMVIAGVSGGALAGMLGVGGGIIYVPALDVVFSLVGIETDISMHVAVATSLAIIIPTSISSALAHRKRDSVDMDLVRLWGSTILLGSISGVIAASQLEGSSLSFGFGMLTLLVAINMLLPIPQINFFTRFSSPSLGFIVPFGLGSFSSMLGVGGGTFSVPILTMLGRPIHRAVGTAAAFGLLISLPGAVSFAVSGWGDGRLPIASLGYVNLIALSIMAPVTALTAPIGASAAHRLGQRQLRLVFGFCLFAICIRMILKTFLN